VPASRPIASDGLPGLRRSGSVTELLFLYACATEGPTQLRPIAEHLGLTVQAASHSFRQLRERGLIAVRDGRYLPTVEGIAWLHGTLTGLAADVRARLDRLHVIRSTRALAAADLAAGAPVSIELKDGLLTARPGADGPSRGRAARPAARGDLVEIDDLEGIVRIAPAAVTVRTISEADLGDRRLDRWIASSLPGAGGLLAAEGLEAYHAVRRLADRPVVRFGVAAAARDAARLGVSSTVFVAERDLARLLEAFAPGEPPRLAVLPVRGGREPGGRRRDRGGRPARQRLQ